MSLVHTIKVKEVQGTDWKIQFYADFDEIIFDKDNLEKVLELIDYAKTQDKPFKWPLNLISFQFLAGVFPDDKLIIIASKNLNYELNLLDFYQFTQRTSEIEELMLHTKKVAQIPLEDSPLVINYISNLHNLPNFDDNEFSKIMDQTDQKTKELSVHLKAYRQTLFEKFSDFGLDLTANYELIRIHLLKFLAILPCLDHDKEGDEVKRTFREAILRLTQDNQISVIKSLKGQQRALPQFYIGIFHVVLFLTRFINAKFLAFMIRKFVALLAKRFIAGEDINKAQGQLNSLLSSNRDATLDQLGELVVSAKEADQYLERVLSIIDGINQHVKKGSRNSVGINKAHISIKVTALCHDFKSQDIEYVYQQIAPRLKKILLRAKEEEVFINIDAEHYHVRDQVFEIYKRVLLETDELKDYKDTGIVIQAYLRDAFTHFKEVVELARERGHIMPIRLVKGAYWDAETIEADAHNYEAPQFLNKEETDIYFRQLAHYALLNGQYIQLALASHNIQDHCFVEILRKELFPSSPGIEHQCLHMTYEALSVGMSKMNWATRNYIPIGDLLIGMAYLVRRIMENSSQVGVLTIMRSHNKASTYKSPLELLKHKSENRELIFDSSLKHLSRDFKNIYPIRTYKMKELKLIEDQLKNDLEKYKTLQVSDDDSQLVSISSSLPDLKLGALLKDNVASVNEKISKLFDGYQSLDWKDNLKTNRFVILSNLSDLLHIHRVRLVSLIMLEAGKSIDEAVADVDEAIDFINFYVREEINLIKKFGYFTSKGVFGIIAPWNFPLAIPVGMSVAALATGNTVILKPSENTPLICHEFLKLARQAGISEEVFELAIGDGEIGKEIVNHELINGVVFTGSRGVGEEIYQKLSTSFVHAKYEIAPESKTIITEMGGKNAIIVTNNCELDETVSGILYAAFAHAGQKCSACSRIIIDKEIKDAFLDRFVDALRDLEVGSSLEFKTTVNPLITLKDKERVKAIAKDIRENLKPNHKIHIDRTNEEYDSFAVGPMLVEVDSDEAFVKESYTCREIFGPIIHLIPYDNLDHAIKIFNATDYALTGGIYAQSQNDIDYLLEGLLAGNIYINRPNTGARVAIEPFGGFKMSGTGPKAGSAAYLKPFHIMNKIERDRFKINDFDIKRSDEFKPVRVSRLNTKDRVLKVREFVNTVLNRYEVFFHNIDELGKDALYDLLEYIDDGNAFLDEREFPNRFIPGQINYDKKQLSLGVGLLVTGENSLDLQHFLTFVFNLIVGNGINVICTKDKGHKYWEDVVNTAYICGLSSYNVNVMCFDSSGLEKVLKEEIYDFVYFDKHLQELARYMDFALKNRNDQRLKKIYLSEEWEDWDNFDSFIEKLTLPRSYAVNTMRHGAPMDLSL